MTDENERINELKKKGWVYDGWENERTNELRKIERMIEWEDRWTKEKRKDECMKG